jgi:cytochrome c-type biogenesis protein CcmH/NrfG
VSLFYAAIVLGVLSAGWVVLPILRRRLALLGDPIPGGVLDAQARKRVALASLKEVEYDRIGGKLDPEDYQRLRAQLEREALLAIRAAEGAAGADEPGEAGFTVTHSCGFVNPPGSRFCSGCGARLG